MTICKEVLPVFLIDLMCLLVIAASIGKIHDFSCSITVELDIELAQNR